MYHDLEPVKVAEETHGPAKPVLEVIAKKHLGSDLLEGVRYRKLGDEFLYCRD